MLSKPWVGEIWKAAELSQTLGVQNIKESGPGLLTQVLLPYSLQWGTSCCLLTRNAALILFWICKGRNEHTSSCCFYQRLFLNSEKIRTGVFSTQCEILQHLLLVHKPAQTLLGEDWWSPQRMETPGVSHSTPQMLEHPRSHCTFFRGEGWAATGRKELCVAEDQVVQLGSTCRWLELLKLLAPFTLPWRWRAGTHLGQSLSGHEKKRNNEWTV